MIRRFLSDFCLAAAMGALLCLSGCAGNGYITSSVGTVVGLDVSENPTTQVPHVRFGYVRSGVYYVPTGKTETKSGVAGSGDASEAPNVVSEITVHSKFITDIIINEKFAIGEAAVDSRAAAASFSNPTAQQLANPNANLSVAPVEIPTEQVIVPPRSESIKVPRSEIQKIVDETLIGAERDKVQRSTVDAFKKWKQGKTDADARQKLDLLGADPKYPRTLNGLLKFIRDTSDPPKLEAIKAALGT